MGGGGGGEVPGEVLGSRQSQEQRTVRSRMSEILSAAISSTPPPLSESRSFGILVCGRTGIGKSSLINCILGEDVCAVGGPEYGENDPFERKTTTVTGHSFTLNNITMTIFDSPGLQDGTEDEASYLAEMKAKCSEVNLVYYCLDATQSRWTPPERNSIRLLTETFGASFWGKTVVVLTKANLLQPTKPNADIPEHFRKWVEEHKKKIRKELSKIVDLSEYRDHCSSIEVIPAGSEAVQQLPNDKHFIGNLWVSSIERIKREDIETFGLSTSVSKRMVSGKRRKRRTRRKLASAHQGPSGSAETDNLHKYPIVVDEEDRTRLRRRLLAVGLIVVGTAVVGAGIGFLIPASGSVLVGGIIGSKLGVAQGGVVGGLLGSAVVGLPWLVSYLNQ